MNAKEFKLAKLYIAPAIEVIDIEMTQNILQPSQPANQQFNLPEYTDGGDAW